MTRNAPAAAAAAAGGLLAVLLLWRRWCVAPASAATTDAAPAALPPRVVIVKGGGSALTYKNQYETVAEQNLQSTAAQAARCLQANRDLGELSDRWGRGGYCRR